MLSIEIRVNGQPVGVVEAHRGQRTSDPFQDDETTMAFEYPYRATFFPLSIGDTPCIYEGAVKHRYHDVMEVLAGLLLAEIAKQKVRNDGPT